MEAKPDSYYFGLHDRRVLGEILSKDELTELEDFYAKKDAEEMQRLAPALSRMAEETEAYRARNARLSELAERQERLVARLRQFAEETRVEHEAIRRELSQLMGSSAS